MKHKLLTLFLALAASVGTLFAQSGTCGENLTWTLSVRTLTISGTGAMTNYAYAPWYSYRSTIKTVVIKDGVTSIGTHAFENCSKLTTITIPYRVTSIGGYAFQGCSSLTSITIPNSVTSIGDGAFEGCTGLTSITIPNSVTSIGYEAFYSCSSLTDLIIGKSVTSIGGKAFSYCSSLTSITIPNSVTSIGGGAFEDCSSLTSVTIPNSVTSIGDGAFQNCSSLTSVTCEAINPPECGGDDPYNGIWVFSGVDKSIPLYVPAQSIDLYKAADQWKDFTYILPIPNVEQYTITWQDEDGNVIKTDQVAQGTTPAFTGTTPTKPATNEYTYEFAGWLPNIKPATEDTKYTTYFIPTQQQESKVYTVNINGENCSLNINNQYPEGTVITLEAVADECFEFQQWSDGNKDNPRTVTVTKDMSLTAEFNKVRYTVTGQPSTDGKVQIRKQ